MRDKRAPAELLPDVDTLLQTKLRMPPLRAARVPRTRLLGMLNMGLAGLFTLISAPAGFGKTTLVSEWLSLPATGPDTLATPASNLAWFSIDESDNDTVRFFTYLGAALQHVDRSVGLALMGMMRAPQLPPLESLVGSLINDLTTLPGEAVLVLDDFHHISNRFIHDALAYFLDHQPAQLHLVIITREDPPLMLSRLRVRGQMTEIRQEDLRFAVDETAVFLNDIMAISTTRENVRALQSRTEGWIAGLQLAALSMRGRSDVSGFVESFTGSNRYILDYLMEEVFQQQSVEVQEFLLNTAILDRLTASLCDVVTERDDSFERLSTLEQANLFVVPLDDSRQWYRYHHLFADLLRHRLRIEMRQLNTLHQRASQWYETNGFLDEAIAHSLAAQDWRQASTLILQASDRLLRRGQMGALLRWMQALPDEVVFAQPELCLNYAWALVLTGQLDHAEEVLVPVGQIADAYPALLSQVVTLRAHIARARRDVPRTIVLSRQALELLPVDDYISRAIIGVNLGAAFMYGGDMPAAIAALDEGIRAAQRSKNHQAHLVALTFLGRVHAAQGRLQRAAGLYRQAIQLWQQRPSLLPVARTHVDLATLLYEWNDLDEAAEHLRLGIELSRRSGEAEIQIAGQRGLARVCQAQGEVEGATIAMQAAVQLAHDALDIPPNVHLATAVAQVQHSLSRGDLAPARLYDEQMMARAAALDPVWAFLLTVTGVVCPFPALTSAQLLLAQSAKLVAMEKLAACAETANQAGLEYSLIAARVMQALSAPTENEAFDFLCEALVLAEKEGYVRLFLDAGESIIPLLRRARQHNVATRYTMKLLSALSADMPSSPLAPPSAAQPLVEPLSERELEILYLLAEYQSNAEIALSLTISVNTTKTHLQHIYEKLGVHDRRAAVSKARELKLLRG